MPNLVVYVPASLWRRIEELGLADPKVEARKVAVGALEQMVNGSLSERGGAGPEAGSVMPKDDGRNTGARRADLGARSLDVPRSESDQHFKPDPKGGRR